MIRLGRLRKTVKAVNTIYGLLLQAHEDLRFRVMALETRDLTTTEALDKEIAEWYD